MTQIFTYLKFRYISSSIKMLYTLKHTVWKESRSVFSCFRTEYGEILRISPYLVRIQEIRISLYLVRIQENADQK